MKTVLGHFYTSFKTVLGQYKDYLTPIWVQAEDSNTVTVLKPSSFSKKSELHASLKKCDTFFGGYRIFYYIWIFPTQQCSRRNNDFVESTIFVLWPVSHGGFTGNFFKMVSFYASSSKLCFQTGESCRKLRRVILQTGKSWQVMARF